MSVAFNDQRPRRQVEQYTPGSRWDPPAKTERKCGVDALRDRIVCVIVVWCGPEMSRTSSTAFALFALAICACGGASSQNSNTGDTASATQTQSVATSSGGDSQRSSANNRCASMGVSSGMSIEGQLGTLRQSEVSATLNPALDRMHTCYAQRLEEHPYLAGGAQFKIRIGTDGAVRWVLPLQSSIGDRATERCMADVLSGLRFPQPCGGETETTWGPTFEGGEDARPAVAWESSRVQTQVNRRRAQLTQCLATVSGASADVTLYVGQGGRVVTAGASVSTQDAASAIECLVNEVSAWRGLPDPGSYPAKATFHLP